MKTTIAALLFCVLACAYAQETVVGRRAQLRLTQSGLQYLTDIQVEALEREMSNLRLPDQRQSGRWTYGATNILITSFDVGAHTVTTIPNVGIRLTLTDIMSSTSLRYSVTYKKGSLYYGDKEDVDVSTWDGSLSLDLKVTTDMGKPQITLTSCSADAGDVDVSIRADLTSRWVFNVFKGMLDKRMSKLIADQMCKKVQDLITKETNTALLTFPSFVPFPELNSQFLTGIYYGVDKPSITDGFLDFNMGGECESPQWNAKWKLSTPRFQVTPKFKKMATLWISEYTINTFAVWAHSSKLFQKVIKPGDKLPKGVSPFLNTVHMKRLIPQLYAKYPNQPIQITLETFKPPQFQLKPGQVRGTAFVRAGVKVLQEDKSLVDVFHVDLTVHVSGVAMIRKEMNQFKLAARITSHKFMLQIGGSTIGKVNLVAEDIDELVKGYVVEKANNMLGKGFPLPQSDHLVLKYPEVSVIENAVRVDTMFEYRG